MCKSLKSFLIEISLCIAVIAVTGQLTANFWERYALQKELYNMKSSLHLFKVTVGNIGIAYDTLQNELTELARINRPLRPRKDFSHKVPEREAAKTVKDELLMEFNDKEINSEFNEDIKDKRISGTKNATTITRNPSKAPKGLKSNNNNQYIKDSKEKYSCKLNNKRRCFENEYCNCS